MKKGDIVGRISYGKDVLFTVEKIIRTKKHEKICILKGLTERIKADAPIEDLEIIDKNIVEKNMKYLEQRLEKRIAQIKQTTRLTRTHCLPMPSS